MICPKCGKWNRASYPVCFACGEPLTPAEKSGIIRPKEDISEERPVVVVYDDYGEEKTLVDQKTRLAEEMRDLHVRKREGERRGAASQACADDEGVLRGDMPKRA